MDKMIIQLLNGDTIEAEEIIVDKSRMLLIALVNHIEVFRCDTNFVWKIEIA